MDSDLRSRKVVEGITALGHSLGLKVVAEGIETELQYLTAKDIGCDLLQGYYFGRPGFAVERWGDFVGRFQGVSPLQTGDVVTALKKVEKVTK